MKIGTKIYRIVGQELKDYFIVEIGRTFYKLRSEEDPTLFYKIQGKDFELNNCFLSRIIGLRTLEEKLFKSLVVTREQIQDFRKEYLKDKDIKEYTDEEINREAYNYDPEAIEGEIT